LGKTNYNKTQKVMKNLKFIFILLFGLLSFIDGNAQVNNTGQMNPALVTTPICRTASNGEKTQLYQVYFINNLGATVNMGLLNKNGATVAADALATDDEGYCVVIGGDGSTGTTGGSSSDFELIERCDDGVDYFVVVKTVNDTVSVIGSYDLSGSTYTVVGSSQYSGPCKTFSRSLGTQERYSTTNTTGSLTTGTVYLSYSVCNVGLKIGTITVNGTTTDLYPNECYHCAEVQQDEKTKGLTCTDDVQWNSTVNGATVFRVSTWKE